MIEAQPSTRSTRAPGWLLRAAQALGHSVTCSGASGGSYDQARGESVQAPRVLALTSVCTAPPGEVSVTLTLVRSSSWPVGLGSGNVHTASASRICPSAWTSCSLVDDPEPSIRNALVVPPAAATASSLLSEPTPMTNVAMGGSPAWAFLAVSVTFSRVEPHTFGSSSVASSTATERSGFCCAQLLAKACAPCRAGKVGVSPEGFCLSSTSPSAGALSGSAPTGTAGTPYASYLQRLAPSSGKNCSPSRRSAAPGAAKKSDSPAFTAVHFGPSIEPDRSSIT